MNLISIQNLVKTLTNGERKTFSLISGVYGAENKYYTLYEYLRDNKAIDIECLEKNFGKNGLETAKKHLSLTLMKALRYAENEGTLENKILNKIMDARIFHKKGLIAESLDLLSKIKEISLENELFTYYLMASRLELEYISRMQFNGIDEYGLIEKQNKIEEILKHEMLVRRHSSLFEILMVRYWRKGIVSNLYEKAKLDDLLLEEYQILNNKNYNSFESQKLHLNFQSTYFMMIGDPEGSLKIFYEINALFKKNMHLSLTSSADYIFMLDGLLTNLRAINKHDEMPFFIKELSGICTQSEDLKTRIAFLIFFHHLTIYNYQQDFKNALIFINENSVLIDQVLKGPLFNLQVQICLAISISYFGLGNVKKSLFFQNFILNNYKKNYSYRLYFQVRVLYLMTQFELKNFDYLNYEIKSFERKIKLENKKNVFENIIIDIFKKLLKEPDNVKNVLDQILEGLNTSQFSPENQRVVQNLQFNKWLSNFKIKIN